MEDCRKGGKPRKGVGFNVYARIRNSQFTTTTPCTDGVILSGGRVHALSWPAAYPFGRFAFYSPTPTCLSTMSAYGAIAKPATTTSSPVTPTSYILPTKQALTVFPCTRASVDDALISYLARVFNDVVEEGLTYPQQKILTEDEFVSAPQIGRAHV